MIGKALEAKAAEMEEAIQKVPGIVDTNAGVIVSGPALTFKVDPQLAAKFGVTASDIAAAVETAITGSDVSLVLQRGRPITVRVVFPKEAGVVARCSEGRCRYGRQAEHLFRLDQVATVDYDKGPNRDKTRRAATD